MRVNGDNDHHSRKARKGLSARKKREDCPGSRRCGTTLSREIVKLACCTMPVKSVIYGKDDPDSTQPIHGADDRTRSRQQLRMASLPPAAAPFQRSACTFPPFAPHHLAAPLVGVIAYCVPARSIAQQPTHLAPNRHRVREWHKYATSAACQYGVEITALPAPKA